MSIEVREVEVPRDETPIIKTLKALTTPMTQSQYQKMFAWIESESRALGQATKRHIVHKHNEAKNELRRLSDTLKPVQERCEQAAAAVASAPDGSWYATIVFCSAAVILMAIEFALTLRSLPQLLGFRSDGFWAYTISASPAVMIIALEVVIARLVEDPWREVRGRISKSHLRRWIMGFIMCVQLLLVGALTGLSVYYIGLTREDAGTKRQELASMAAGVDDPASEGDAAEIDAAKARLRAAIIILSLAVALDGALVLVVGTHEGGLLREKSRRKKAHKRALRHQADTEDRYSKAQTEVDDTGSQLEAVDEHAEIEEEKHRKWLEYELQASQARTMQHMSQADRMKTQLALAMG